MLNKLFGRESSIWWFGLVLAIITFLQSSPKPPTEWTYAEWLQGFAVLLAWFSGKMGWSWGTKSN